MLYTNFNIFPDISRATIRNEKRTVIDVRNGAEDIVSVRDSVLPPGPRPSLLLRDVIPLLPEPTGIPVGREALASHTESNCRVTAYTGIKYIIYIHFSFIL